MEMICTVLMMKNKERMCRHFQIEMMVSEYLRYHFLKYHLKKVISLFFVGFNLHSMRESNIDNIFGAMEV